MFGVPIAHMPAVHLGAITHHQHLCPRERCCPGPPTSLLHNWAGAPGPHSRLGDPIMRMMSHSLAGRCHAILWASAGRQDAYQRGDCVWDSACRGQPKHRSAPKWQRSFTLLALAFGAVLTRELFLMQNCVEHSHRQSFCPSLLYHN